METLIECICFVPIKKHILSTELCIYKVRHYEITLLKSCNIFYLCIGEVPIKR